MVAYDSLNLKGGKTCAVVLEAAVFATQRSHGCSCGNSDKWLPRRQWRDTISAVEIALDSNIMLIKQ